MYIRLFISILISFFFEYLSNTVSGWWNQGDGQTAGDDIWAPQLHSCAASDAHHLPPSVVLACAWRHNMNDTNERRDIYNYFVYVCKNKEYI